MTAPAATIEIARPADADWSPPVPSTGNWWAWRITHPGASMIGAHRGTKEETQAIVHKHVSAMDDIYVGQLRKLRYRAGSRMKNTWLGDTYRQTRAA